MILLLSFHSDPTTIKLKIKFFNLKFLSIAPYKIGYQVKSITEKMTYLFKYCLSKQKRKWLYI